MTAAVALTVAVTITLVFDFTNGFHDSANSVAALVATRAATPGAALLLAAVCHVAGPLLAGTTVADTVGGVVRLPAADVLPAVGAAVTAGIAWNLLTWWRGLPSSSSHALVGGLVGACFVSTGLAGIRWGGVDGFHVAGVLGVLVGLALSPVLGAGLGAAADRLARRALRRARRRADVALRRAEWVSAGALAFSHGANDAQKSMGVITLLLVATGHLGAFAVPLWVKLAAAAALTLGTASGGWRVVKTVGRGIYRMRPVDGLASQGSSAAVILAAAAAGAPVSTTHVVAASVVGAGASRHAHHVRWAVVGEICSAWLVTLPACAVLGAAALPLWRWFA
ncbi:inorganic phosphate transporter [Amycolatopsis mongoliensis]|uniref:Inorganic phosphate transporter n=1 Tax=Amycolatopsis mongoliensis TaxID=715475 RepID=A0A9Y2JKY8_9PSEU|nr:inorganic phosphate transporter [Amycolatopsis sp. 4-36]WIY00440.1 inorganic phosphate transporter [Amycolatopsis sp. 4-36]